MADSDSVNPANSLSYLARYVDAVRIIPAR